MATEPDPVEIPDVAMRTGSDANAVVGEVDHDENERNAQSLQDVFDEWFRRFNVDDPEAKARPSPGWLSWPAALSKVAELNERLVDAERIDANRVLYDVPCRSRHMHAPPTDLPPDWHVSGQFQLETQHHRVLPPNLGTAPQNWFAVEVHGGTLSQILSVIENAEATTPLLGTGPNGGTPTQPSVPSPAQNSAALCPDGYAVVHTADGFCAAWYGRPRQSEAEAVADAWRHSTQKGTTH